MMELINGECLTEMSKLINEGRTVDLVLTDPPYNINHNGNDWDNREEEDYLGFMTEVFNKSYDLLKYNGTLIFFHNDILMISKLINILNDNSDFNFNSFITLTKDYFRTIAWRNPSNEKSNLRCWFNTCEYVIVFTKGDELDKTSIDNFKSLRNYSQDLLNYTGVTKKDIERKLGHRKAEHFFYTRKQWSLCTEEVYNELIDNYNLRDWDGFREYNSLKQELEDLRPTHNLGEYHNNVWSFEKNNDKYHSCQKPINTLEKLLLTHSNPGDIVLDCFMGSGSTGVACKNLNRSFIGIELDKKYYDISKERINTNQEVLKL